MTDTSDSYSTTTSLDTSGGELNPGFDRLQTFCKQMLKTRTFLGHYQENRLVQNLQSYRALVVISKTDESLAKDIELVRQRIKTFYSHNPQYWMGYTDSSMIGVPHGSCIWTELDGVPFGEYWFQIKTVRFRNSEAIIKLKMLRPMHDVEESIKQEHKIKENQCNYDSGQMAKDFQELLEMWRKSSSDYFLWLFSQITAQNIAGVLKFICLILIAAGTASIHGLMHLGAFTLKFMAEFRKLIHVSMPILLKVLDLLSKFIGGIFILLAMIWRDLIGRRDPAPGYNQQIINPALGFRDQTPLRPIEYRAGMRNNRGFGSTNRYRRT